MKLNLNLGLKMLGLFAVALLSAAASVQAAEVGEMTAEETECRLENGNVEPPTGLAPQFQMLPVENQDADDTKKSVKVK